MIIELTGMKVKYTKDTETSSYDGSKRVGFAEIEGHPIWVESRQIETIIFELLPCNSSYEIDGQELVSSRLETTGKSFNVKETPHQIQEMIMLNEFDKVALTGICANSNIKGRHRNIGFLAMSMAHDMVTARKEAMKRDGDYTH